MRLLSRIIRLPLRLVPPNRTVRIMSGELRGWKWITGSATHGCWLGTYEREAQNAFKESIREGQVVYDVGANVGFFTLLAAKLVGASGAVYAFEPLERNVEQLRRHIDLNQLTTVHVFPIALSAQPGVAFFDSTSNPAMGRLTSDGKTKVTVDTLDNLHAAGSIAAPHLIKMDVEGAEYDVLTGAADVLRRHHPAILLSTHGYRVHEQCCAYLRALQYEITMLRDGTADGHYTLMATASGV